MQTTTSKFARLNVAKALLLTGSTFAMLAASQTAFAQSTAEDEVVVVGTRATIQDSLNLKRQETSIVDGLSATEIGEIPALSIGEALETLTGASSHRENGGATEISIRGLGPFLSSTTFNGRVATNGSGDRSVNFSQFPSELMSKIAIYKTQDASLIEGGVAGQIALETLKPLDYGKRRFQFDLKGNYNPDQSNITGAMVGDIGFRGTASYVDQFETPNGALIGISLGGQLSKISQPEQEIRSTSPTGSSRFACIINGSGANSNQGYSETAPSDDDCEDNPAGSSNNGAYNTAIDPATGLAFDDGELFTFAQSQRGFRQNDTMDKRDSLFGAVQIQPNDFWEINFDAQWSQRTQAEDRYDITSDNAKRNERSISIGGFTSTLDSLRTDGMGETLRIAYDSEFASAGEIYERVEDYIGFGAGISYEASDKLTVSTDFSFSETTRSELQQSLRVQNGSRVEMIYSIESGTPQYTIENLDVTDIMSFDDDIRLRVDTDVDRKNTIMAGRFDVNYEVDKGFADSIDAGVRYSELSYKNLAGARDTFTLSDGDTSIYACATPFAETNFLDSVNSGDLFTFVDGAGNVTGTSNNWATFDNACLSEAIRNGSPLAYPGLTEASSSTTDVTETTIAGYIKANFTGEWGDFPVRGNYGVRVLNTDVTSVGYRDGYSIGTDANGSLILITDSSVTERVEGGSGYTEILPSFNLVADLREDLLLRGGLYRGLSRADPSDMSYARSFSGTTPAPGDIITDVDDLLNVTAQGNPNYKPLTSWNADAAVEWYANEDSLLAVGVYYKQFKGGFESAVTTEDFVVDGQSTTLPVTINSTNSETSNLWGVELTATHRFSYLPGLLSGFGTKVSYNYAESDFDFEDSNYGDRGFRDANGNFVQTHAGIIAPGSIPGLSKHVLSAQVYWQSGDFDIAGYYKYRDDYFQPYTSNGSRLRFVGANEVFEARASYKINKNFKVTVQGLNLFNEPRTDYFYQENNFGQASVYGPRVFFGIKGKF